MTSPLAVAVVQLRFCRLVAPFAVRFCVIALPLTSTVNFAPLTLSLFVLTFPKLPVAPTLRTVELRYPKEPVAPVRPPDAYSWPLQYVEPFRKELAYDSTKSSFCTSMKYALSVPVLVTAFALRPPFRRVRLPSRLLLIVPEVMLQSVKYTVVG